jgi:hypothetical protein
MKIEKIQEYSEIYLQSYLYTMEQTKNQDLAVAVAMGVLCSIRTLDNIQQKEEVKMVNPLEAFTAAIMQAAAERDSQGGVDEQKQ